MARSRLIKPPTEQRLARSRRAPQHASMQAAKGAAASGGGPRVQMRRRRQRAPACTCACSNSRRRAYGSRPAAAATVASLVHRGRRRAPPQPAGAAASGRLPARVCACKTPPGNCLHACARARNSAGRSQQQAHHGGGAHDRRAHSARHRAARGGAGRGGGGLRGTRSRSLHVTPPDLHLQGGAWGLRIR